VADLQLVKVILPLVCMTALAVLLPRSLAAQDQRDRATVSKGEYLARAGDCVACHTAPEGRLFAGGRAMPTPFGTLYTSNITSDDETGIGKWTADQFYMTMHVGRFPDGGLLYPAMPFGSYTKVTRVLVTVALLLGFYSAWFAVRP